MGFRIAERWFEFQRIDDDITLIWEPHVDPLIRCNIWHVRGGERDMLVDAGLGIASLRATAMHLLNKPVLAVATHTHFDHVGGLHEFPQRVVHRAEAKALEEPSGFAALLLRNLEDGVVEAIRAAGYPIPGDLIEALPADGYDPAAYRVLPAPATRLVEDGDLIALGRRRFEVLHLPGHSPGSIGLWEAETGTLFAGDAIYDGPLIDNLPGTDIADYSRTMARLKTLPVRVVHAGHDPSFGRERLHQIADRYLAKWQAEGVVAGSLNGQGRTPCPS
jgi:glyoxylase-like metal-dependent hydrolase (beta-lactamase superfamily II)